MIRALYALLALIPLSIAGYASCAGEDELAEEAGAESEQTIVEVGKQVIIGTFRSEPAVSSGVAVLTLMTDGAFHREMAVVCARHPCNRPEDEGRYTLAYNDGRWVMSLYSRAGAVIDQYDYLYRDGALFLRRAGTDAAWDVLQRSEEAWCGAPTDCALQSLPVGPCGAGAWTCSTNVCGYRCGPEAPSE